MDTTDTDTPDNSAEARRKRLEARRGKAAPKPLPASKALGMATTYQVGALTLALTAPPLRRMAQVQEALFTLPTLLVVAALSADAGIDPEAMAELVTVQVRSLDPDAEAVTVAQVRHDWQTLSLEAPDHAPALAAVISLLGHPLDPDALLDLSLPDWVEAVRVCFDACGGFPGDLRDRFTTP